MNSSRVLGYLLAISVALGCSDSAGPVSVTNEPSSRRLGLAVAGEIEVVINVGGVPLNTSHGNWTATLSPVGTHHGGSASSSVISMNPGVTRPDVFEAPCPGGVPCARNINIKDGIRGVTPEPEDGIIWNGVYTLDIQRADTGEPCPYELVQSHKDTDNNTFLDATWMDQKLTLNFPAGPGCAFPEWSVQHQKPAIPLTVSIDAPTTVNTNESFTVTATPGGGFGSYTFVRNCSASQPFGQLARS